MSPSNDPDPLAGDGEAPPPTDAEFRETLRRERVEAAESRVADRDYRRLELGIEALDARLRFALMTHLAENDLASFSLIDASMLALDEMGEVVK